MCIKLVIWNKSILWCTVRKTSNYCEFLLLDFTKKKTPNCCKIMFLVKFCKLMIWKRQYDIVTNMWFDWQVIRDSILMRLNIILYPHLPSSYISYLLLMNLHPIPSSTVVFKGFATISVKCSAKFCMLFFCR